MHAHRGRRFVAEGRVDLPDAEVVAGEVHHEQGIAGAVGLDPLVDVLAQPPAAVLAGEVVAELLVDPRGEPARPRVDLDPVVRVFDRVRRGREVVRRGRHLRRDERVAESGQLDAHTPGVHVRQCASPRDIRREELLEHSDGGAAAPQVGLLDDHRPRPRQRVDDEQLDSLRPRVGLLVGQLAEVEPALDAALGARVGERARRPGEHVVRLHRRLVGKRRLAAPLRSREE